jgi:hypothetical protein
MAAPTLYRSDDASAPVISGSAGTLLAALTAILVNGYGSKAAAGWTAPYTDTNKAVFRQGGGHQRYLRVDDTAAQLARLTGYGTIADVDGVTSTNLFPSAVQFAGGMYFRKSVTADGTARPWICLATNTHVYMIIFGNRTLTLAAALQDGGDSHFGFGELTNTRVTSDINNSFLCGASDTSTTSTTSTGLRQCLVSLGTTAQQTLHLNGSFNQGSSASTQVYKRSTQMYSANESGGAGTAFPDYGRGGLVTYPFAVIEPTQIVRGELPGVHVVCHSTNGTSMPGNLTIFEGVGSNSGRQFLYVKTGAAWSLVFDLTGNW